MSDEAAERTGRTPWSRSLPFRVVVTTLVAALTILAATGWFLMDQSSRGILDGRKQASLAEASVVLDGMQRELRTINQRTASINERLTQLARDAAYRGSVGNQYYVVVAGPVSDIGSAGLDYSSVPESLRLAVLGPDGVYSTPTEIRFADARQAVPGLAIGAALTDTAGIRYPVYFLFTQQPEAETLAVVQRATLVAGAIVLVGLVVMVYLIALQVLRPIRAARLAAERLAAGHLDDRMAVVGTEDLAGLARSMNHMATELDRKITELEDLSLVQQQFVSDVSHELRTPLTTVRMAADVLYQHRDTFEPLAARSTELLSEELDRFEMLLTDLLEISRFDAGAAELSVDEVDLSQLASDELAAQRRLAQRYGTPLVLDAPEPCLAEVDVRRIQRILRNLITNAIEHGEGRPVSVHVRADDAAVAVAVRDHGVGFSAAQAHQVFNRFWRADPARRRTVGGSGLGLSIALGDARLHGGWLNAWGRPGQGAQFRLTVPKHSGGGFVSSPWPVVPSDARVNA
ncbi:MtrAB system histidine kinase MtrB [Micropruina sonneratiae]|uniref:MtrAB system histidine kinase MtrB n=1 Tax=Micropruina sonneratiae TaxID=2986940 RepID=UPI0022279240|nr:MtrAB system histidine kinase MtrB [Micropruina sp. KQZ13P-5]MCW3157425.1 MtrAB system histidine kinase MtrB [Micropruina sp. KQZ13P-5]